MPTFCLEQMVTAQAITPALLGVCLGIAGFAPLFAAVLLARRSARPSVAMGLAAVAVSFVFLTACEVAVWIVRPAWLMPVATGMLLAFFASWALLALKASRRR